jgi:hypothetical protein
MAGVLLVTTVLSLGGLVRCGLHRGAVWSRCRLAENNTIRSLSAATWLVTRGDNGELGVGVVIAAAKSWRLAEMRSSADGEGMVSWCGNQLRVSVSRSRRVSHAQTL